MIAGRIKKLFPYWFRYFINSCIPKLHKIDTIVLKNPKLIEKLYTIDQHFEIRTIGKNDLNEIKKFHDTRGKKSFKNKVPQRLNSNAFTGIAAFDKRTGEIAYLSWVISKSIDYFEEFGFTLGEGDFMIKDVFVVPKYRHKGLSVRMEQERINYCIRSGAKKIYTQPLTDNTKGKEVYFKLGFEYLKTNLLIQWAVFNIWRDFHSFIKNPFKKVLK